MLRTLSTLFLFVLFILPAQAALSPAEPIDEAQAAYDAGDYERTIQIATDLAGDRDRSPLERVEALRLQGLSHIALGDEVAAQTSVDEMIRIFPGYTQKVGDTDTFNALVADAQERHAAGELKRQPQESEGSGFMQKVYTGIAIVGSAAVLVIGALDMAG